MRESHEVDAYVTVYYYAHAGIAGNCPGYQSAPSKQCQAPCRSSADPRRRQQSSLLQQPFSVRELLPRVTSTSRNPSRSRRPPSNRGRSSASQKSSRAVDLRPIKRAALLESSARLRTGVIWQLGISQHRRIRTAPSPRLAETRSD